jgi:hypothetical protein
MVADSSTCLPAESVKSAVPCPLTEGGGLSRWAAAFVVKEMNRNSRTLKEKLRYFMEPPNKHNGFKRKLFGN